MKSIRSIGNNTGNGSAPKKALPRRLLIAALFLPLLLAACGKKDSQPEASADQARLTLVDVARAKAQDVQVLVRSVGSLEAIDRVKIAPEIRGTVKEIHFKENQKVEKGRLLVELDDRKLKLEVEQSKEALETAKAAKDLAMATIRRSEADVENRKSVFGRDKELFDSGITSESVYVQSKTAYESAQAAVEEAKAAYRKAEKGVAMAETQLALARERLNDTRIVAPLSGILGERLISPGDYVDSGQPMVELVVKDPIEIAFSVPEKYKGRIRTGQAVLFDSPSVPDHTFSGETTFISPAADPATRSIKLKARLSNEEDLLQPGLFGEVRLVLETHENASVIPESAVVPRGEETYVYVADNSKAQLRKVVLGEHFDGSVEAVEGIRPGEIVITAGQQKVADGFAVRMRNSADDEPKKEKPEQAGTAPVTEER